jgi:hypothetical protein
MKHLLPLLLLLASCAGTHRPAAAPVASEPIAAPGPVAAPAPVAEPKRGLLGKIFGRTPSTSPAKSIAEPYKVPRKCKGCTFNVVAGDQTNAGKKATVQAEGAVNVGKQRPAGDRRGDRDRQYQSRQQRRRGSNGGWRDGYGYHREAADALAQVRLVAGGARRRLLAAVWRWRGPGASPVAQE